MRWPPRRDDLNVKSVPFSLSSGVGAAYVGATRLLALTLSLPGVVTATPVVWADGVDANGELLGNLSTDDLGNLRLIIGLPGWALDTGLFLSTTAPIVGALLLAEEL